MYFNSIKTFLPHLTDNIQTSFEVTNVKICCVPHKITFPILIPSLFKPQVLNASFARKLESQGLENPRQIKNNCYFSRSVERSELLIESEARSAESIKARSTESRCDVAPNARAVRRRMRISIRVFLFFF